MSNQVFYLHDGWYAIVNGRTFGTWDNKGAALAGLAVEERRAAAREAASKAVC